jgi:hypothetical protein
VRTRCSGISAVWRTEYRNIQPAGAPPHPLLHLKLKSEARRMTRQTSIIIFVVGIIWIAANLATVLRAKSGCAALMYFGIAVISLAAAL